MGRDTGPTAYLLPLFFPPPRKGNLLGEIIGPRPEALSSRRRSPLARAWLRTWIDLRSNTRVKTLLGRAGRGGGGSVVQPRDVSSVLVPSYCRRCHRGTIRERYSSSRWEKRRARCERNNRPVKLNVSNVVPRGNGNEKRPMKIKQFCTTLSNVHRLAVYYILNTK